MFYICYINILNYFLCFNWKKVIPLIQLTIIFFLVKLFESIHSILLILFISFKLLFISKSIAFCTTGREAIKYSLLTNKKSFTLLKDLILLNRKYSSLLSYIKKLINLSSKIASILFDSSIH